ncbi:retrotransposon protein, putative, ty1-copia subclass [Tanacetum coccineum]
MNHMRNVNLVYLGRWREAFPHQVKRPKDLLGLIHTDVCGPFRTMSREGANYFITFTDDFSHCGFVYLMKHKHEVFETFKVFQNEVENQLGKKIKAIRSDRGGEYPRYALETATRILNMVPTKKVDKTPYEIWHEKAPKLSYVEPQNVRVPIHKYARIPQAPDRYGYYVDIEEYELGDLNEPPNYKAALANPESDKWLEDMHTETFSHVADIRAIRILLAIAAFYDYEIWKIDVKTAFLNGHLSEDVYMVQLEEFVDPTHPNKVCKLQRFIYGLKQASRSWNKRFDKEIKKIGFT